MIMEKSNFVQRMRLEFKYYFTVPWTLRDVGEFWDTVEDYDAINEKIYPYYERFLNSENLLKMTNLTIPSNSSVLDIQCRSGKGTEFWASKLSSDAMFTCVDFSEGLIQKAENRLNMYTNVKFNVILSEDFQLSEKFDLILCYETIEHVYNKLVFLNSLKEHLKETGVMVVSHPNILWELIHSFTFVVGINHSEGPRRFPSRMKMHEMFSELDLKVVAENTTILLPFNFKLSIIIDRFLTRCLPDFIVRNLALRRTYLLKKVL